ncbi:uncharacterized protein LOC127849884 [Dreissena polymorpha]|nr:uncharacterized protein LOC127849884 [Dreissena polymorpha]
MVDLLLESRLETFCNESGTGSLQVDRIYKHFVLRLYENLRQHLAALNYIPGTFTGDQAAKMLVSDYGSCAMAKWKAIRPIRIRHMLNFDADRKRFDIQGIIREIVKAEIVIKDLPGVRTRYCEIYSAVMKEISRNMGGADFVKALEAFSVEQVNLSKLLH